ncbi:unnamed protein product [Miscanthus lutarioriparius]|uniref:Uncharacterized protein n=1 Tax=Miscanthus lutarioriparius TaxID=422564 RepID=A0A811QFM8_9POAL|nr:unnamed protein product [Miscanthus lutarioriparius]
MAAAGNDGDRAIISVEAAARRRWSLRGMTTLVTGGTRGIGRAVVEELAALGAAVHTCSQNEAELRERLAEWEATTAKTGGMTVNGLYPAHRQD